MQDMKLYKSLNQERSHLAPIIDQLRLMRSLNTQINEAHQLMKDETDQEMLEMTREELHELERNWSCANRKPRFCSYPPIPWKARTSSWKSVPEPVAKRPPVCCGPVQNVFSLCRCEGWKMEILSSNETGIGGYKELVVSISGKDVYGSLRWESGVHRVQRVPETENGGRIHTSAVTVAVLPEAEETDIEIRQEDLKIDVMRAGGPGGQCVNTTDSAVRLTHLPTGLVVICQDEKSQIKNRAKALRVLRSRLYDLEEEKKNRERAEARKNQVGSGDRSERIRTYNFPQNRLTDHRINLTLYKLELIMAGQLDEVIEALKIAAGEAALKEG
jgi:peptide chain release factor 1